MDNGSPELSQQLPEPLRVAVAEMREAERKYKELEKRRDIRLGFFVFATVWLPLAIGLWRWALS